jgi:hypothetical protein
MILFDVVKLVACQLNLLIFQPLESNIFQFFTHETLSSKSNVTLYDQSSFFIIVLHSLLKYGTSVSSETRLTDVVTVFVALFVSIAVIQRLCDQFS